MARRFRLGIPVRIASGVLALVGVPFVISTMRGADGIAWRSAAGFIALGMLFLYGAIRGESPAWLEPQSMPGDPPAGTGDTSRPNDR